MITREDICRRYDTIKAYLRRTPVIRVDLGALAESIPVGTWPTEIVLKLEQMQCAGSFKARGAFANLLLRAVPSSGVVAASGGNHGVAVAYAARRLGMAAKIFVPTVSASAKVERIRRLGADLVGGGGLIGGVCAYFAGSVRVIGIEPDGAPTLTYARAHGKPTDAPTGSIAADALAPRRVGDLVFPITQAHVSDVVLVDDDSIRRAQHALWEALRVIAEPAAAVGVAALLAGAYRPQPGERVGVIISGSNITPSDLDPAATAPR